ncbi:efflux RND transporter periplasmic adaptor subunit [Legionella londiniensis]|uniref:Acriflavin resistance protein E n=1 Tax=Legionella londiniensis TaxID=45068 RepID=A0A0W0VP79_9GAMM|nr:efflux RND transporter periplasmic adaptor subunit [Legionella londiniensis]KTD21875.1 acriflavin resistance protein E [Legionella londiniensis]STX92642.1 acriflavin resistance protein [Legionella londiniensis]
MNRITRKRMTIMIILLVIVFGGIIAFNAFKAFMMKRFFASFEPPAVTVSSVTAKEQDWEPTISAVGNFAAINGVEVNSQAAGNVVAIHFDSGQFIEKGHPLIDIDDSVEQATLKFNKSDLALQEINYKRQTDLFKKGATPSSNVDEARAKLLQAQANVEKTQALINQKHITAPFSGQLGIRQVNLGQYVSPGQTAIVSLQSLDPLFLEFYLPEQYLKQLYIGQNITFAVEQNPKYRFHGIITAINSKVDVNTHNILVQATVPNCPAKAVAMPKTSKLVKIKKQKLFTRELLICDTDLNTKNHVTEFNFIPGMFAALEVEQPSVSKVVVLPSTAISYSLYGNSVFVIEKDKEGKKDEKGQDILRVKRVFVTTGDQQGNYTIIQKGIEPGQEVVSAGELKLQDGTRVIINNDVQLDQEVNPQELSQ